jgi:hypothetical protein
VRLVNFTAPTSREATVSIDRLMAQLDGAELVKYDPAGYVLAWFGGASTGIHVYDGSGEEVGYWQMGALTTGGYSVREVRESMNERMLDAEGYPC